MVLQKFLLPLLLFTYAFSVDKVVMLTENYPPYNMNSNGKISGVAVDILGAMQKKMGKESHGVRKGQACRAS